MNQRRDEPAFGEMSSQIPYKSVLEVSAGSLEQLTAALGADATAPWRDADLCVITRECVLWDRLS